MVSTEIVAFDPQILQVPVLFTEQNPKGRASISDAMSDPLKNPCRSPGTYGARAHFLLRCLGAVASRDHGENVVLHDDARDINFAETEELPVCCSLWYRGLYFFERPIRDF